MEKNISIVLFVLAFLIAILIAIRVSSKSNEAEKVLDDDLIDVGDLVEFQQEFDDGYYTFSPGERAWVTEYADYDHVVVSNKHDGYCATDGAEPFKFCKVPASILKKVKSKDTNQHE